MKKEIFVTEEASGEPGSIKFLSEQCEEYSRSFLQKLMKSGGVFADGPSGKGQLQGVGRRPADL